jgi:dTDP-4-amino-4,6-dideoxygalactose transaminase
MSNLSAALGYVQFAQLRNALESKRRLFERFKIDCSDMEGVRLIE